MDFNPRSRVGNDASQSLSPMLILHFNPRSRVGNDWNLRAIVSYVRISIHVPAWGTTEDCWIIMIQWYFNPRSRVGNDFFDSLFENFSIISIHVPAWGTTDSSVFSALTGSISIHVPAWGTTPWTWSMHLTVRFQSTFPRGERLAVWSVLVCSFYFNPRSRVGNDNRFC